MAFLLSSRNMAGWPVGVRFCPGGKVLITHYLLKKVKGEPIPVDVITECDLYSDRTPWEIYEEKKPREEKRPRKLVEEENQADKLFVFTKLKKGCQNDSVRFAACGEWHLDEASVQEIKDGNTNQVIGLVKEFVFKAKKGDSPTSDDNDDDGHWIMKEYSLAGSSLVGLSEDPDYVVCELLYE